MTRPAWPLRLAAAEGRATARTGRWTSALLVVAVAWTVAAGAIDAIGVTRLVAAEREWIDAGGYVYVAEGMTVENASTPIPTEACEALVGVDGIAASFALRRTDLSGALAHAPGGWVSAVGVSPGVSPFFDVPTEPDGVMIGTAGFVGRSGVRDGETVRVTVRSASDARAAGVESDPLTLRAPDTRALTEDLDGVMLLPTVLGPEADRCYVRTDAAHAATVESMLSAMLGYEGRPAVVSPRLPRSEFMVDYSTAFEERPLRWMWVPSALLLGLLWGMVQWFRRSHMAIYATFGMRTAPRLVMQSVEWGALAALGLLWGWSLGVVGAVTFGARVEQALAQVTWHAALTVLGASVLVVLLGLRPTGTLLTALKDR